MPGPEQKESLKRCGRLQELLKPVEGESYERMAERLIEAREILHEEFAFQLEPVLNEYLKTLPQATLQERQQLSRWLNAKLRSSFGLSVRCPKTMLASVLHADAGKGMGAGRFQIELIDGDEGRKRTSTTSTLPYVSLMPYPFGKRVNAEPADWVKKITKSMATETRRG